MNTCYRCKKEFIKKTDYISHVKKNNCDFECKSCDYKMKKNICPFCNKLFDGIKNLNIHIIKNCPQFKIEQDEFHDILYLQHNIYKNEKFKLYVEKIKRRFDIRHYLGHVYIYCKKILDSSEPDLGDSDKIIARHKRESKSKHKFETFNNMKIIISYSGTDVFIFYKDNNKLHNYYHHSQIYKPNGEIIRFDNKKSVK